MKPFPFLLSAVIATGLAPAQEITEGCLLAQDAAGQRVSFVLERTDVRARVAGYVATVEVVQKFSNPFDRAVEAVYVFPLPARAAVDGFVLEVAGRRVVGTVMPRPDAVKTYEDARAAGRTASLLTQERPNLFTQQVANIPPGKAVTVTLTYVERLRGEGGGYEFVFPMAVTPRYGPFTRGGARGLSTPPSQDATPAPVTSAPPLPPLRVLPAGQRCGRTIGLVLDIDAGFPLRELKCVTHDVSEEGVNLGRSVLRLKNADAIPDRDFVCRWSVAAERTQLAALAERRGADGFMTLMLQPPLDPAAADVTPREITFIVDVSGSMHGTPIRMAKEIVGRTLDRLRPGDIFNVFVFAGANAQLWDSPRPGNDSAIAEAKRFLESHQGAGGTEMMAGLERALAADHDPARLQMYCFLTDGCVTEEERILAAIKTRRGNARFFAFGPGPGVNRHLLDGIGEEGGGTTVYANPRDERETERCVQDFLRATDAPVLVDIAIDWNGLPVDEAYPARIPDLFAGRTIDVVARYAAPAVGTAIVRGRVGARRVEFPVAVVLPQQTEARGLGSVWARQRVHDLSREMLGAAAERRAEIEAEITRLGVRHRLLTPCTAFVAVDLSRITGDGRPARVVEALDRPEGLSDLCAVTDISEVVEEFNTVVDDAVNPFAATSERFGMAEGTDDAQDNLLTMSSGGKGLTGAIGVGGGAGAAAGAPTGGSRMTRRNSQRGQLAATEKCVNIADDWLSRHQAPDGCWDPAMVPRLCDPARGAPCGGSGGPGRAPGLTGLALLAFLGSGYDNLRPSPYQETVRNGLKWLRQHQDADGWFSPGADPISLVDHAAATIALCEAYAATGLSAWKKPAQAGLDFALRRLPGARTEWPAAALRGDGELESVAWLLLALKAGKDAALPVSGTALAEAVEFLAACTDPATGRLGVAPERIDRLTALGLFVRIWCGAAKPEDALVRKGVDHLLSLVAGDPSVRPRLDAATWYFGSLALRHAGGDAWDRWLPRLKQAVVEGQTKDGCALGSFDPADFPSPGGSRLESTTLMTLALEIYYRFPRVFGSTR